MPAELIIARAWARQTLARITPWRGEVAVATAFFAGWLLITLAIARIRRPDIVWPLSTGILLFALCGYGFLFRIVRDGLYAMTKGTNG